MTQSAIVTMTAPAGAVAVLEEGKVLVLPQGGFALEARERVLLNPDLLGGAKNISLSPDGVLKNTRATDAERPLLTQMMQRYAAFATELVETVAPCYRGHLRRGRTSFRPAEIEGRKSSAIADDSRLHVDAFPTTPMAGRRILRVFANVNPEASRIWNTGENFESVARQFLPRLTTKPAAWHRLLKILGITKGLRTAYDDVMLGLHDGAKLDLTYQNSCEKQRVEFAPGTVWLCYTDQVMHAALKGQHVLEQTFYLPPAAMADPATTPLAVLERLMGRALV